MSTRTARKWWLSRAQLSLWVILLSVTPWHAAQAYVDPNTVGPLYQFLFPLFIAVASAFAALRRHLARLWNRLLGVVLAAVRGERAPPGSQRDR